MNQMPLVRMFVAVAVVVCLLLPDIARAAPAVDVFGLNWIHPVDKVADDTRLGQSVALGAKWDRFPIYWNAIQPTPNGPFDFTKVDPIINANQSRGIRTQAVLVGAPEWANAGGQFNYDGWSRFVSTTVARYKGRVSHWEMWNEPDLLDGEGKGKYWTGGPAEYARLLKYGYLAAKSSDAGSTVLMAGLALTHNNQEFFNQFLDALVKDADASRNNWFFDVLPIHVYDRPLRAYELPMGYLGYPSFAGLRTLMKRRGFIKPIWINEMGVPVWDYSTGQKAPGRATQDEQASFILQSIAYSMVVGVERMFFSQLYDDGAGAIDPNNRQPAEFFGLISNDGRPRPAYAAYQVAIQHLSGTKLTTRLNVGKTIKNQNSKGLEIISFWGTPQGRITVAWNGESSGPLEAVVPAISPTARILDKYGRLVTTVSAKDGVFRMTLPQATNNNNFNCYTPRGCDPGDYIMGGHPFMLVEESQFVPAVAFEPLPTASIIPFRVAWTPSRSLPAGTLYDVQYKDLTTDPVDGGWKDWYTATNLTSANFGGDVAITRDHSYAFRVRARDVAGRLVDGDWPAVPLANTLAVAGATWPPPKSEVDAKTEIVWPHGNAPVDKAEKANITANVFKTGGLTSVNPNWGSPPILWRSIDNGVEENVGPGKPRIVTSGALKYPVWDFNDVDVSAARDPKRKIYFRMSMDGKYESTNVWSHALDARTFLPHPDVPTATLSEMPTSVDAKIEIVWPHENAQVDKATKANVAAYLFEHGSLRSVPLSFDGQVVLFRSLNNDPGQPVSLGDKSTKTVNGVTFPVWTFNDIDVSAARDRQNKYYFRLQVSGAEAYSNVWSHASDARSFVPKPDVPTAVAP